MKVSLSFPLGHMQTKPKEFRWHAPGQNSPLFGVQFCLGAGCFSLPACENSMPASVRSLNHVWGFYKAKLPKSQLYSREQCGVTESAHGAAYSPSPHQEQRRGLLSWLKEWARAEHLELSTQLMRSYRCFAFLLHFLCRFNLYELLLR